MVVLVTAVILLMRAHIAIAISATNLHTPTVVIAVAAGTNVPIAAHHPLVTLNSIIVISSQLHSLETLSRGIRVRANLMVAPLLLVAQRTTPRLFLPLPGAALCPSSLTIIDLCAHPLLHLLLL